MVLTIFANVRKFLHCGVLLTAAMLLSACGTKQVIVEGRFPSPLMNKIPLTMGVWYEDAFANHEFFDETKSREESDWIVKTGHAQLEMWNALLGGMFENLVHLEARPSPESNSPLVDAVLIPHIEELQYTIPIHTNVNVYEIWMRYRFELVTSGGDTLADWLMTAYGKTPTAFLQSAEDAVNLAAVMALRDAGAHFVIDFAREPAVRDWLQRNEKIKHD